MADHQIKIDRAHRLAPTAPTVTAEIMANISDYLVERLTAEELAEVKRSMDKHWHRATAHAEREIVASGLVWDAAEGRHREVA